MIDLGKFNPQNLDDDKINNVIDLNKFKKQNIDDDEPEHSVSVMEIRSRLLRNAKSVVSYLLTGVQFRQGKGFVGDISGNRGDSMIVEIEGAKAGMWFDHATGEGGDILDLWAATHGKSTKTDFPGVIDSITEWLDGTSRKRDFQLSSPGPKKKEPPMDNVGPRTGEWFYTDSNGKHIARVWRYDPVDEETGEISKEYRPYDILAKKMGAPKFRPLYNQVGMAKSLTVVLTEGEKCAQALIDAGICATTAMMGAGAPVDKTDWSPLRGKSVMIWPDKDEPGWKYAVSASKAITEAGASHVTILEPEEDKPKGWDAADLIADGGDPAAFIATVKRHDVRREAVVLSIFDWTADKFSGKAPVQRHLIEGGFPLEVAAILAAMGDSGKGMMTLDLALKVATGAPDHAHATAPRCFGGAVQEFGTAVIFTAEDDAGEVHRRLERLDPHGVRLKRPDKLIIVPMPNAGGPIPLVSSGKDGPVITDGFLRIQDQLMRIADLKMVVFDPLSSFIHADVNADPAAGSFATGLLASLATETKASVIIPHHMRKPQGGKPISSAEQARDAIRGSSAIVDGVRMVYALWPAPEENQSAIIKALKIDRVKNGIYYGAVVKANGLADRTVRTYTRNDTGLLIDVTQSIANVKMPSSDAQEILIKTIAAAAAEGMPFTKSGQANGLYENKHRLPVEVRETSRTRLRYMADGLLESGRLVLAGAPGEKSRQWLDVPDGDFALGRGKFTAGAPEVSNA